MASQLRFEGGELEELLERVRIEVGPEARIVAANRIRQGGIAGFFAREGYEVVVDADGVQNGGRGSRGRRRSKSEAKSQSTTQPVDASVIIDDASPTTSAVTASSGTASVLDLVDEVNEIERDQVIDLSETAAPTVSTEHTDFGTMLANLTRELDEEEASMPTTTRQRRSRLAERALPARHRRGRGAGRHDRNGPAAPAPALPVVIPRRRARIDAAARRRPAPARAGSADRSHAVDRGDRRPAHRALPAPRATAAAAGPAPHHRRRDRDRRHRYRADRAWPAASPTSSTSIPRTCCSRRPKR